MRVLLVEDSAADARLVSEMTRDAAAPSAIELVHVSRLVDAIRRLTFEPFDAVLLDLGLPDAGGLDALRSVQEHSPDLPIVVFTGRRDIGEALEAVRKGAQDYLLKDSADGALMYRALQYAIERKHSERQIEHIAYHDGLTNLPNRRLFFDRLNQAIARARRQKGLLGVVFLDLDHFKIINDTLGHLAGDHLLQEAAGRLSEQVRDSDTLARLGGDEFGLLVPDLSRPRDVNHVASKLQWALEPPFYLNGREHRLSASIGISIYPRDAVTAEGLLRRADEAMYHAKRNGSRIFSNDAATRVHGESERLSLAADLRRALDAEEFVLFYQPRVNAHTGSMLGVEALLRWQHPDHGLLPPLRFVPLAEELGLLEPIGRWVLRTACAQGQKWNSRDGESPLRMSVNISCREFSQRGLPGVVAAALRAADFQAGQLELELTESGIMQDEKESLSCLLELKELGVHLCIDDFGIGHSSLSRLRNVPIDTLKIDRSFVKDVATDPSNAAIVTAIVTMARGMGLRVVAEGVETEQQKASLSSLGCDEMQGFFFSPPQPAEVVTELITQTLG